jgi:dTDP-4-dehydrorhamnose 3,5-epimerase
MSLGATELDLPGCLELRPPVHSDDRGRLVKPFNREWFARLGLATDFAEDYYSISRRGVLRGLHLQLPPMEHDKLVYCSRGRIWDVLLDLRRGSPTFAHHIALELSAEVANMCYVAAGVAHGFCVLSDEACVHYLVSSTHSPEHDAGVRWDSAGIDWPVADAIVSLRDGALPPLAEFASPFHFAADE